MIALGIECSSPRGSLALLRDGRPLGSRSWDAGRRTNREAFDALDDLLREAGLEAAAIDLFAAGRGPGNYSGMRMALTLAQALALPGNRPVVAVPSGAALAWQILRDAPGPAAAVVGDARRGQFWMGVFHHGADPATPPVQVGDWALLAAGGLAAALPADAAVVSPEWDRLAAALPAGVFAAGHWIREARYPQAETVAALALHRAESGEPSDPLVPIYLHPAVAAAPGAAGGDAHA